MNFQCKNCGGNVVYDPERLTMYCEYCGTQDSETVKGDGSTTVCASCGGEISIEQFTSASRCPYCDNYLIFDERVSGNYKPDTIIPFKVSKKSGIELLRKHFCKRTFAPIGFLSDASVKGMTGFYVPFFLYDYVADSSLVAEGVKVKSYRSGDYQITERAYYDVRRKLHAIYDNVPVDASFDFEDDKMDLIEPYDYQKLMEFDPKYLSGFFGEMYNSTPENFAYRAERKVSDSARGIIRNSLRGYSTVRTIDENTTLSKGRIDYTLLPVWLYVYKFRGKEYRYFINGESGKVIGKMPVAISKIFIYGASLAAMVYAGAVMISSILGAL